MPSLAVEELLRRGVSRLLVDMGYGTLCEFKLTTGRRVDMIGLNDRCEFVIAEIKSSVADYRGDNKWREYLPFCDRFYFAVPVEFPQSILPGDCGVIVAVGYGGAIRRPAMPAAVNASRKRRQIVRFAIAASSRLHRVFDPHG